MIVAKTIKSLHTFLLQSWNRRQPKQNMQIFSYYYFKIKKGLAIDTSITGHGWDLSLLLQVLILSTVERLLVFLKNDEPLKRFKKISSSNFFWLCKYLWVRTPLRGTILNFCSFLDNFWDIFQAKKNLFCNKTQDLDPVSSDRTGLNCNKN